MSARFLPFSNYAALKAATRDLVRRCGGPSRAAGITRVTQQVLSRYGDAGEDHADRFAPIDAIADLEAELGEPVVTRQLAAIAGYTLRPKEAACRNIGSAAAVFAATSGEATREVFTALADGTITPEEAAAAAPFFCRVADEAARLCAQLQARASNHDAG